MTTTLFATATGRWDRTDRAGRYYRGGAQVGYFNLLFSCTLATARRRDGRWEKRVCSSPIEAQQWIEDVGV
jgi:hypothetical protein